MTPCHEYTQARRKVSAQRAIQTRQRRRINCIEQLAEAIIKGEQIGPFPRCRLCGRSLSEPASVERAIGAECIAAVNEAVERKRITA